VSIRLSREEAWAELAAGHTGIFTTLRADGVPITLPVWFVALDERIYVASPAHRKKVGRIQRDPRVSFLVESGERWAELKGVHLTGRAHRIHDPKRIAQVRELLDRKYGSFRAERAAMPEVTRSQYETEIAVMEIVPDERVLSFDNARIELADG
jgi:nitroimidazol reductase NimA-like FMN-containing flavoprotein (pyridoxamine 5'-phosphate oxidase superfamily)